MPRQPKLPNNQAFTYENDSGSSREQIDAFRRRQEEDLRRFHRTEPVIRRRPFYERYKASDQEKYEDPKHQSKDSPFDGGEEAWRDSEGDRLDDFGVDEDIEFYDEDDIPLAELLLRQREKPRIRNDEFTDS